MIILALLILVVLAALVIFADDNFTPPTGPSHWNLWD